LAESNSLHSWQHPRGGADLPAPPLVLVHGAGGSHLSWPPQVRRLEGIRVYAPDLPGHGQSVGPAEGTLSGHAERLAGWLDQLALPPVVLAGHSMGGAIALVLALRQPRRIAGLILVASAARIRVAPAILEAASAGGGHQRAIDLVLGSAFGDQAPPGLHQQVARQLAAGNPKAFLLDFQASDNFDMRRRLSEIEAPALVIAGDRDQLIPLHLSQELAAGLANGRLEVITGAGHMLMLEVPQAVAQHICQFVRTLQQRADG